MSHKHKERDEVYAVLRYDAFHDATALPEECVTVKEVVRSREAAEAEVARLNAINSEKNCRYWCQQTRLFPEGCSAGENPN
ncbi:MAG: hypothetical protein ACR2FY_04340 [Pirellulaceae bacterium]